ncbi:MAG: hypothetical protein GY762_02085 [Proteobacteria bacterium]|nr:hypothetical protein [Pseudomonadota bacterium]
MKEIFLTIFVCLALTSAQALAEVCPPELAPWSLEGDWDGDGLTDTMDNCCYVYSPENQPAGEICPETNLGDVDLNDNGIPASEEGLCCIDKYDISPHCYEIAAADTCVSMVPPVSCDRLLLYDNGTAGNVCGFSPLPPCICYTIGDYEPDGFGPTDNCPTVENPRQIDSDGDGWGDACDMCRDLPISDATGAACQHCDSKDCLPYFIPPTADTLYPYIGYRCPYSPHEFEPGYEDADQDQVGDNCGDNCLGVPNFDQVNSDEDPWGDACDNCPLLTTPEPLPDTDQDGIGDACDNCPLLATAESQPDTDQDGTGDACDPCPEKAYEDVHEDMDEDGVPDDCDNCPDIANREQYDADEDGIGNACAKIKYTGAFTCDHSPASRNKSPAFLLGKILSIF